MKKLIALVKNDFSLEFNSFFYDEKKKLIKKTVAAILLMIFMTCSLETSLIVAFDYFKSKNMQYLILNMIIILEIFIITILSIRKILNHLFLISDWDKLFIYPVKNGIILLSKFITICYQNLIISIIFFIPLITYCLLDSLKVGLVISLLLISLIIAIIIPIYIILISLTLLWLKTIIKKSKTKYKYNNLFLIYDLSVIILSYFLIHYMNNLKIVMIIALAIIIITSITFYYIGGNLYFTIMKSNTTFFKYKKVENIEPSKYSFKPYNIIISNIIRDMNLITRTPVLRANCIITPLVLTVFLVCPMYFLASSLNGIINDIGLVNIGIYLGIYVWCLCINMPTASTSFSREGSALKFFKIYPIKANKYVLSKLYVAMINSIIIFISFSILIGFASNNLKDFIILEVLLLNYLLTINMVNIKFDAKNFTSNWIDIKELFDIQKIMKSILPGNIALLLLGAYALIGNIFFHFRINTRNSYFAIGIIIIINILISVICYKKTLRNIEMK